MAIKNNKISAIIEEQIPDFIREDHDNFVQFLKSYYEFLESESPPTRLPLIIDNPFPTIYNPIDNPYGGQFQIGETIQQKANSDDPTEVTASAKVFAWSEDATTQTAIITSFGGTSKTFIKDSEIVGEKSGVKFFPVDKTESLKAGSTRASLDILDTKDIDNTLDDYVQYIKNEFAVNLPLSLHDTTDTRTVLKNIRDFYKARGTENSFKFLFRLLYGEDSSIYIPETDMLRASDANWKNITVIRTSVPDVDPRTQQSVTTSDLVGRKIKGETSLATAIVEKATELIYAGARFVEVELSSKLGTFVAEEFIETDNVGDGTIVRTKVLGLLNNIKITDSGSNYVVGDRVVVNSGGGVGAIAEVATTNATSGAITSMKIIDPGYNYSSVPTLDMTTPHNADAGAARFEAGPLETIYYNDFSQYTDANSFFVESDNRGPKSNVGPSTNHPYDALAYSSYRGTPNPANVTANSILNFVTVPGVDEGLKGYWKMNSYYHKDVTISTADAAANVASNTGHNPVANNAFRGPRVGDITFVANPNYDSMASTQINYVNHTYTNAMAVPDRTEANTYLSTGWIGFQPVVYDASGHGHHARASVSELGAQSLSTRPTLNLFSENAFSNVGIFGAGSNALAMQSRGVDQVALGEGGLVLMTHDDIRNANTQSWVFWYYPHGPDIQNTDHNSTPNKQRRLLTRGQNYWWSITTNTYTTAGSAGHNTTDDFIDVIVSHHDANFDNTSAVSRTNGKIANTSGLYPGYKDGAEPYGGFSDGGHLRIKRWNMIALTLDYNDQGVAGGGAATGKGVGNVYIFNTSDGLHVANGFSIDISKTSANVAGQTGDIEGGLPYAGESGSGPLYAQGRAVKLGGIVKSANGDSWATERELVANGAYDEVRYYDKALSWNQIEHLFYNPGGRYDDVLSGDWKALNQGTQFYSSTKPVDVNFPATTGTGGKYLKVGNAVDSKVDGLQIVTNKNIPFDPTIRYKMSANAKDESASTGSNTYIGIIGISNTGIELIGSAGVPAWNSHYPIVQSAGGVPAESGSLGAKWFTYKAVYGGNTTNLGTHSSTDKYGHGGNNEQTGFGGYNNKQEFKWANPVRLFGSKAAATQQGTGNTTFVRPIMLINAWSVNDSTLIDYIKIEQQKDATLTAEIGAEFKQAGEYLDDSGKIGTSPATSWRPKFIQDDKYYQIYSYVIKSGLSIGTYKEVVKKLVHPAGLIMFGQVDIQTLVSITMKSFDETLAGDIIDLLREYYMGAESSLLSDYADVPISGRNVGYHTQFGLNTVGEADFDLDAAHGVNPHGAGKNTPGSPGWIAWDQSPLTSPYANSHYYTPLDSIWPYEDQRLGYAPYTTSNAYTTVTNDSLIWNIKGWRTLLVSPFENENVGALYAHSLISASHQTPSNAGLGQYGWEKASTTYGTSGPLDIYGVTAPLDIDGSVHRYVRMKIRRIGPGGYGADSWLGVCQPTTNPSSTTGGSHWRPTLGLTPTDWNADELVPGNPFIPRMTDRSLFYASANTTQPSTLINSADVLPGTKSPWHILEWDMWELGETYSFNYPDNGGKTMWKDADASTGASPQDGGTGRRIGAMSFQLCYEPDNKPVGEKFEIEWIQVDDGDGWQRGSYALPGGYANTWTSATDSAGLSLNHTGTGTGGAPYRKRISESTDFGNQTVGDFSVTVAPAATNPSEISTGAPVLYVHSDKFIFNSSDSAVSTYGLNANDHVFDSNGAIFRVSANTANNLDWVVTEIIDSEKFLRNAPGSPALGDYVGGGTLTGNGQFSGPVILDTDANDNLYVGYLYESNNGSYPGFTENYYSKPLMLFRLTPTANVQTDLSKPSDPHNLRSVGSSAGSWYGARGRSNTYSVEQILWGNTGGTDGIGVMTGGYPLYGVGNIQWAESESGGASGSFVDFSTDDLGSLYVVGSGSQNIIKILPAANTSYANGVTRVIANPTGQSTGRQVFEIANTTTIDANNNVLGNWRPTNIIPGPKDSLFVACDTGYGGNGAFGLFDTSTATRITDSSGTDDEPAYSPDGTKIAFVSNRTGYNEVYMMDADGTNQEQLTFSENVVGDGKPAWSPDGTKIAFTTYRDSDSLGLSGEIYVMDADGSNQTRLSNQGANDRHPAWSPDGTKIAFCSNKDSWMTGGYDIFVMDATDASGMTNLTYVSSSAFVHDHPTWSPDGTKIAFESDRDGEWQIYVMDADGSSETSLSAEASVRDRWPKWSPDGRQIAFTGYRSGVYDIWVMASADGAHKTNITNVGTVEYDSAWYPDGSKIIFSSYRDGNYELYTITRPVNLSWRANNSVYCYHVVTEQNIATGEYYTKNVYPVFANVQSFNVPTIIAGSYDGLNIEGLRQSCAGLVLDHEEPPNLYYMSANNMYRIKPKGYSYQMGDTEIEQVFPEDYFHNTLKMPVNIHNVLGFSRYGIGATSSPYIRYQNNYQRIQVDSRNRIYFGGMANLYCYSRGSNTSGPENNGLPLFNQSSTEFSTLQVVVNTAMYTSNINYGSYGSMTVSIDSFVLGAKTSNSAFTGGDPGNPSTGANNFSEGVYITMHDGQAVTSIAGGTTFSNENGRRLVVVYPNANGSFVESEGGQLAMTIMDENPAANTKYAVDGTEGVNKFRGIGPGKVVLRPEKV